MKSSPFQTSDLALCAALQVSGHVVESINRDNPKRVLFFVSPIEQLEQTVQDFWAGKLLVEPNAYFQALRLLKSRIRQ